MVLLAVVVVGGLVWLARHYRGGLRADRTDGTGPGLPRRPVGSRRGSPALVYPGRQGRRCLVVHGGTGPGYRVPRPERRGEDDDTADAARPGRADLGNGHH